ncbi:j-protein (type III) [Orbilia ellipsospora]|uniref:J-protein (Type III) n=1 Tax=Orbilia ellipsospora TaxID=2528407 RepID=A0AAV9XFT1_9PEZI
MTAPDHYATLGILQTATINEIKKAYKSKAIATHPDKNGGTKNATFAFQKVLDAYECLSDSCKRKIYDINYKPATPFTSGNSASNSSFGNRSNMWSQPSYAQTNSNYGSSSSTYTTPPDLKAEENRFNERWRSHNLRKVEIDIDRFNLRMAKFKIDSLRGQEKKAKDELEIRKQEWEYKTKRSWLGESLWGKIVVPKAEIAEKEKKDRENYDQISSIRIKLAKLDRETKIMEEKEKEWDRQESSRIRELETLEARKRLRKAAYEAEVKRKADEAKRKAQEEARQAREKAERERLEKLRKAREEEEKCRREKEEERRKEQQKRWEEMMEQERIYQEQVRKTRAADQTRRRQEELRKEREAQLAEEQRQKRNREAATEQERQRKRRDAQARARRNQNPPQHAHTGNVACSHSKFWTKVTITSERCSKCQKIYHSFLFQCPGCEIRACAACRIELRGKPQKA